MRPSGTKPDQARASSWDLATSRRTSGHHEPGAAGGERGVHTTRGPSHRAQPMRAGSSAAAQQKCR